MCEKQELESDKEMPYSFGIREMFFCTRADEGREQRTGKERRCTHDIVPRLGD